MVLQTGTSCPGTPSLSQQFLHGKGQEAQPVPELGCLGNVWAQEFSGTVCLWTSLVQQGQGKQRQQRSVCQEARVSESPRGHGRARQALVPKATAPRPRRKGPADRPEASLGDSSCHSSLTQHWSSLCYLDPRNGPRDTSQDSPGSHLSLDTGLGQT